MVNTLIMSILMVLCGIVGVGVSGIICGSEPCGHHEISTILYIMSIIMILLGMIVGAMTMLIFLGII